MKTARVASPLVRHTEVVGASTGGTSLDAAPSPDAYAGVHADAVSRPAEAQVGPDRRRLTRYINEFVAATHLMNGPRPHENLAKSKLTAGLRFGQVPYWDIDSKTEGLFFVGDEQGSPFVKESGKHRIYAHYLDAPRIAYLTQRFGAPRHTPAAITSSYRTLVLPDEGVLLKFSGEFMKEVFSLPDGVTKALTPEQVRRSVHNSEAFRNRASAVPEPSGLILEGNEQTLTILHRALPMPKDNVLGPNDQLAPLHSWAAEMFGNTRIGRNAKARFGSLQAWADSQLAPKLAQEIFQSLQTGDHREIHTQNVLALVDGEGNVRELFQQDHQDILPDVAMMVLNGRTPSTTDIERLLQSPYSGLTDYYLRYLSQSMRDGNEVLGLPSSLHLALPSEESIERALLELAMSTLTEPLETGSASFSALTDDESPGVYVTLARIRGVMLEAALAKRFVPDPRARERFMDDQAIVLGANNALLSRARLDSEELEFGFVADVPVAIVRRDTGAPVAAAFCFDAGPPPTG